MTNDDNLLSSPTEAMKARLAGRLEDAMTDRVKVAKIEWSDWCEYHTTFFVYCIMEDNSERIFSFCPGSPAGFCETSPGDKPPTTRAKILPVDFEARD